MDKTYTIAGVSTQGKITKFRVCNGDKDARYKVLERNGCTEINLIDLPSAMSKIDAINYYKSLHPTSDSIRMPNEPAATLPKVKTVSINKNKRVKDAAADLLNAIEES